MANFGVDGFCVQNVFLFWLDMIQQLVLHSMVGKATKCRKWVVLASATKCFLIWTILMICFTFQFNLDRYCQGMKRERTGSLLLYFAMTNCPY
ncbi:hypothetical protein AQUCO_00200197v1 [Aquilegia coerulea]|uniref:Uncharacterized protein n=1 Tax=Aquilegia coerulea TaxID=218851 RepID=A0A2G5F2A3_AQUCA|nr:hypothetical protein AQUCO_00200197v1 [Aquilegia coerulea]